jgi:LPXTG-motif cell wall-anchored protein
LANTGSDVGVLTGAALVLLLAGAAALLAVRRPRAH